ncbi:MAG: FHA domain-containing protein [Alphaproteobacteria bacterium]|nr:FHA domain-containing protein [Alphaproteobacteria bacterium]MBF0391247.1 FHA domain-containing protein [Alphaproteobacteria bacterium]
MPGRSNRPGHQGAPDDGTSPPTVTMPPTRMLDDPASVEPQRKEPRTRLFRPGGVPADDQQSDASVDPVVGWLVVVSGPGRGRALAISYGMNSIGRADDEKVVLNFGDEQISRKGHAMVTYDRRGRRFYLQHGGGANLTYLGDAPVLVPVEMSGGELISLGETVLRFAPFCGPGFDWQDQ